MFSGEERHTGFHIDFNSSHSEVTSASLRCHRNLDSMPRLASARCNVESLLRIHVDVASIALRSQTIRKHVNCTASSLRCQSDGTYIALRFLFDDTSTELQSHLKLSPSPLRFPSHVLLDEVAPASRQGVNCQHTQMCTISHTQTQNCRRISN